MNQSLKEKCQVFVANKEAIEKKFKWESSYVIPACGMLYTEKNVTVNSEKLEQCNDIVKKEMSIFSNFRGCVKMVLISKMALSDNPKSYLDKVVRTYDLLKKHRISATEYTALAAMVIADNDAVTEPEGVVEKVKILYDQMKKNHPLLTSSEDAAFASLLAMSELTEDVVLKEMEVCYNALLPKFSSSNAVQSLSHILALDTRDSEVKCNEVVTLYEMLKKKGKKYDSSAISVLGGLIMLDVEKDKLVSDILEVDAYLKEQKGFGFWGIGDKQRLLYATALVMNWYTSGKEEMQITILTSSVALMIAEQMAMLAAISAANAAAASANA